MTDDFSNRLRAQLKLALMGDCGCPQALEEIEAHARELGLTGAEIDVAYTGLSFEARSSASLSFACALKSGSSDLVEQTRQRALRLGMVEKELNQIAIEARHIMSSLRLWQA